MLKLDKHQGTKRIWIWLLLSLWTVAAVGVLAPRKAAAQDDAAKANAGGGEKADSGGDKKPPPKEMQSFFMWFIESSGPIGLGVLLPLSIYFIATVSRLFVELRPIVAMPPEMIAKCEALLEQRDFKSIFAEVKEDNSFFSTALSTGIAELPNGLGEAREAMERVGESVQTEMEKKISMLAVLGTLGPMIGLLGTLTGMIKSFGAIARGGEQLDPTAVAKGISEALLLTFEGVGLSVPAIWFFSFFRNRVTTISVNTMVRADQFLRHFAHAARAKGAGAAVAATARPAPAAATAPRA